MNPFENLVPQQNRVATKNQGAENPFEGLVQKKAASDNSMTKSLTESGVGSLPILKQLTQAGIGIGSAIGKSGLSLGQGFLKASQGIANVLKTGADYSPLIKNIEDIKTNVYDKPYENELNSTSGKIGTGIGNVAPYLASGGTTAALSNAATESVPVIKGAGALRTLAGAGAEAASNFGQGYLLSGGDTKQALTQGATAGLLKGATGALGEIANSTKLPQRLMGSVYKTDKNTVSKIFDETNTTSKGNTKSLSKWAVDQGLKGSLEAQAIKVRSILKQSEDAVIKSAEASKKRISVAPNLFKMAQGIQSDFQDVGRGEIASKADQFLRSVKDNSVSVKDAIDFRRLIDNTLRTKSSFNNPALADNLAYWAEDLRKAINNTDGIGEINKDYTQAIKAREALINAATSAGNTKALGALESYAIGGGMLTGEPASGLLTVMAKRTLGSPRATSNIAQIVKNLPKSSSTGSKTRSIISQQLGILLKDRS